MASSITEAELAALLRQAGLALPGEQQARLREAHAALRAMAERNRTASTTGEAWAEPATTFSAEPGR